MKAAELLKRLEKMGEVLVLSKINIEVVLDENKDAHDVNVGGEIYEYEEGDVLELIGEPAYDLSTQSITLHARPK